MKYEFMTARRDDDSFPGNFTDGLNGLGRAGWFIASCGWNEDGTIMVSALLQRPLTDRKDPLWKDDEPLPISDLKVRDTKGVRLFDVTHDADGTRVSFNRSPYGRTGGEDRAELSAELPLSPVIILDLTEVSHLPNDWWRYLGRLGASAKRNSVTVVIETTDASKARELAERVGAAVNLEFREVELDDLG